LINENRVKGVVTIAILFNRMQYGYSMWAGWTRSDGVKPPESGSVLQPFSLQGFIPFVRWNVAAMWTELDRGMLTILTSTDLSDTVFAPNAVLMGCDGKVIPY
jgi:hypothetical protein